jgi:hypothetical protein
MKWAGELELAQLKPDPMNPRVHDEWQIEQLIRSIEEFGWTNPILAQAAPEPPYLILAGHGRLMAAHRIGRKTAPVVLLDMTEVQASAYNLADNKLTDLSWMDETRERARLLFLHEQGFDVTIAGYDESELMDKLHQAMDEGSTEPQRRHPKMEIQGYEHYDYLVFFFRDLRDFMRACELMGVKQVDSSSSFKSSKVGLGRCLDGRRLLLMQPKLVEPEKPLVSPIEGASKALPVGEEAKEAV